MALAYFRMFIYKFLNKDQDKNPEEAPLIILIKSGVCMANNVKYTKHTRNIVNGLNVLRKGEKWKRDNIDWCEGGLHLVDIASKNVR